MKEQRKKEFHDDGRTVASMNFHRYTAFSTVSPKDNIIVKKHESDLSLTRKERFAVIIALYMTLIPFVVIMFLIFLLVFGIIFTIWR